MEPAVIATKKLSDFVRSVSLAYLLIGSSVQTVHAQTNSGRLLVEVRGAQANVGQILLVVFSNKDNYLSEPIIELDEMVDANGGSSFALEDLAFGTYAVGAIYDENSNGEMDSNFLGIPKELVGFSNDPRSMFGPPSFKKSSFEFSEDMSITIRVSKAKD